MAIGTTKKSSGRRRNISYSRYGYFFIIPFFIVYLIFSLTPLFSTFGYSTTNMGETNSKFYGFSDTEAYYDQYLNLKDLYSSNFEGDVGITPKEYSNMKAYFVLQKIITNQDPFNEEGMKAIAGLTDISDSAKANIQEYLSTKDPSVITADTMTALKTYSDTFKPLDIVITNDLPKVISAINDIKNSPAVDTDAETLATLSTTIMDQIPALVDELTALKTADVTDTNKAAVMAVDYYATKLNDGKAPGNSFDSLISFYNSFTTDSSALHNYSLYTTSKGLLKSQAITVDFTADLATIFTAGDWITTINSLSTVPTMNKFANAELDLHNDQLLKDLTTLNDAGIINVDILVEKDGKLVLDTQNGLLSNLNNLIVTNFQPDLNKSRAIAQIRKLGIYVNDTTARAIMNNLDAIKANGGIDKYMNFSGDRTVNVNKYLDYKSVLGIADKLNLAKYNALDAKRKSDEVTQAKADLADYEKQLPDAKAAYDAAVATGDAKTINTANEALATVTVGIRTENANIKTPSGILQFSAAGEKYVFVGLENYKSIFTDTNRFNKVFGDLWNTVIMWLMNYVPQLLLALLLASWMTDNRLKMKGTGAMKALIYMPSLMTAATIAIFFYRTFQYSTNPDSKAMAQQILRIFGHPEGYNFFARPWAKRTVIAFINFWMWYGNTMIILIAGISSVSVSLFESAQIDGATSGQVFRKITLPMIRPIMLYTLVISLIGGLQMYDIPKLLGNGEPAGFFRGTKIKSTETILMYIQNQAFGPSAVHQVGLAAAVSVVLFIITCICSGVLFYVMRDKEAGRMKKLAKRGGDVK